MKNIVIFFILLAVAFACNDSKKTETITNTESTTKPATNLPTADNSMTSVDWPGTYLGTLPCADCEGIETQLTLNADLTFVLQTKYLGQMDSPFKTVGTFEWDEAGRVITLMTEGADDAIHYQVGENILFKLDANRNRIDGDLAKMYWLHKQ